MDTKSYYVFVFKDVYYVISNKNSNIQSNLTGLGTTLVHKIKKKIIKLLNNDNKIFDYILTEMNNKKNKTNVFITISEPEIDKFLIEWIYTINFDNNSFSIEGWEHTLRFSLYNIPENWIFLYENMQYIKYANKSESEFDKIMDNVIDNTVKSKL